jgi:hypothetical protein
MVLLHAQLNQTGQHSSVLLVHALLNQTGQHSSVLLVHARLNQKAIYTVQFVHSATELSAVQLAVCFITGPVEGSIHSRQMVSVVSRGRLMLFRETVSDYCEDHMEHINTVRVVHIVTTVKHYHHICAQRMLGAVNIERPRFSYICQCRDVSPN